MGVYRSRTAIHDWVRKADLQPDSDVDQNQIAVNEKVILANGKRYRLYAAVDTGTNQFRNYRLFQTRKVQLAVLFLRELRKKQQFSDVTFLIDTATHLKTALDRISLRHYVFSMEIETLSNVSFVIGYNKHICFYICSRTRSDRPPNCG